MRKLLAIIFAAIVVTVGCSRDGDGLRKRPEKPGDTIRTDTARADTTHTDTTHADTVRVDTVRTDTAQVDPLIFTVDSINYKVVDSGIVHVRFLIDTAYHLLPASHIGFKLDNGTITIPSVVRHKGRQYRVTAIDLPGDGYYQYASWPAGWKWYPDPGTIGIYKWISVSRPTVVLPEGVDTIYNMFPVSRVTDLYLPKTFRYFGYVPLSCPDHVDYTFDIRAISSVTRIHVNSIEDWLSIDYDPRNDESSRVPLGIVDICIGGEPVKKLEVPKSVTELRPHAFSGLYTLQTVKIHDGVKSIGRAAFQECKHLVSATLPAGLREIRDNLFLYCENLQNVGMPQSLRKIEENAFYMCKALKSITIPAGVDTIGSDAFSGCESLVSVKLPAGLKEIRSDLFSYCENLQNVEMPQSLRKIEENAFYMCKALKSITIPAGVDTIEDCAFEYCKSLRDIYCLGKTPPHIYNFRGVFLYIDKDACLHVPAGAVEAYKSDDEWGRCQHIVPIEEARQKVRALPR